MECPIIHVVVRLLSSNDHPNASFSNVPIIKGVTDLGLRGARIAQSVARLASD